MGGLKNKTAAVRPNFLAALLGFAVCLSLPALSHEVCMNNKWARHLCASSARFAFKYRESIGTIIYIQTEVPKTQKYLSQKMYELLPPLLCSPLAQ